MLKNGALMPVEIARIGKPRAAEPITEPISSIYSISPLSSAAIGDIRTHLDKLHFRAMLQIKSAVFGDERHEKSQ